MHCTSNKLKLHDFAFFQIWDCWRVHKLYNLWYINQKMDFTSKPFHMEHVKTDEENTSQFVTLAQTSSASDGKKRINCQNKSNGCSYFVDEHMVFTLKNHENECKYRMIPCQSPVCKENMPYRDILDHIRVTTDIQLSQRSCQLWIPRRDQCRWWP